jgi:hypothetical protein
MPVTHTRGSAPARQSPHAVGALNRGGSRRERVHPMRRLGIAAAMFVLGFGVVGWAASAASASCGSSTPASFSFADRQDDGIDTQGNPDPRRYAPDIVAVDVVADASCNLSVGATLGDHPSSPGSLYAGEIMAFYLNTDGNRSTGLTSAAGADRVIVTYGDNFGPDYTRLGTFNGSGFSFADAPGRAYEWGGRTMTFESLGISSPATLEILAVGLFDESLVRLGSNTYYDFAPDDGVSAFQAPIQFSAGPGPGPGPTPGPGPGPRPGPTPGPGPGSTPDPVQPERFCRVPRVERMQVARARRRLESAGCRYRVQRLASRRVRRGRVISTSPPAGRTTSRSVVLRISSGRPR